MIIFVHFVTNFLLKPIKRTYCYFILSFLFVYIVLCLYLLKVQACCSGHTPQLSGLSVWAVVSDRKKGLVALHPLIGLLEIFWVGAATEM